MIVNYLRKAIGQQTGGHISPLAAYDAKVDRFLILDVARYKYPPVWVKTSDLFDAMNTTDAANDNKTRGYVLGRQNRRYNARHYDARHRDARHRDARTSAMIRTKMRWYRSSAARRLIFSLASLGLVGALALPLLTHGPALGESQLDPQSGPGAIRHRQKRHGGGASRRLPRASAPTFCNAAAMRSTRRSRPGFAMAVTYPRAGNIGGGGFMIIHRSSGER